MWSWAWLVVLATCVLQATLVTKPDTAVLYCGGSMAAALRTTGIRLDSSLSLGGVIWTR